MPRGLLIEAGKSYAIKTASNDYYAVAKVKYALPKSKDISQFYGISGLINNSSKPQANFAAGIMFPSEYLVYNSSPVSITSQPLRQGASPDVIIRYAHSAVYLEMLNGAQAAENSNPANLAANKYESFSPDIFWKNPPFLYRVANLSDGTVGPTFIPSFETYVFKVKGIDYKVQLTEMNHKTITLRWMLLSDTRPID